MKIGHPVDLVIFDCDGVLIDSEIISNFTLVQALANLGYSISETQALRRFVGRSYRSIQEDIEADWGQALPPSFEIDLEEATLKSMTEALQPISGIHNVLSTLRLRRCVASSSSIAWIRQGLTLTGLIQHLDPYLFSASMVENGKPAPDLFLHAAEKMETSPTRCVVIEDSLPGVEAGVAAGMTVIGFTGGSHVVDPNHGEALRGIGAHHLIDDMTALSSLLDPGPLDH